MKCNLCKGHSPIAGFSTFKKKDGTKGRRGVCRECRNKYGEDNFKRLQKYRKDYNKNNRTNNSVKSALRRSVAKIAIDAIKVKTPCADCGKRFPAVAMDFDHIGVKNKSIADMVSKAYRVDFILEEVKLCEVVCACCHRVRTAKRGQNMGRIK